MRLSPDEVGEVLRRKGVSGARFEGRPTVEEVAEQAEMSVQEVHSIVQGLRSLGAAIDAPSGELEQIRIQAEEYEDVEEDPKALARAAEDYAGIRMEGGAGKLPKTTRLILIAAVFIFLLLLVLSLTSRSPRPDANASAPRERPEQYAPA